MADSVKDPSEENSIIIDWTNRLPSGVTISSATWTVPTGIMKSAQSETSVLTSVTLAGGTAGTNYLLTVLVTGSDALTYEDRAIVRVQDSTLGEPVTLEECKEHLRVDADDSAEDGYIRSLITAAREYCEIVQNRTYLSTTRTLVLDHFPSSREIIMPYSPLSSVTSIAYIDTDGVSQTMTASTDYEVDTSHEPGRIYLAYSASWPTPRTIPNAVTITYVGGYGTAEDVPERIKLAVKMLVAHWFELRMPYQTAKSEPVPMHLGALIGHNRMYTF